MVTKYGDGTGIILDYLHSLELLKAAENTELYAPSMSTVREEALLSLVIFEKAELVKSATIERELVAEKLVSEGIIEYVPGTAFESALKLIDSYTGNIYTDSISDWKDREHGDTEELTTALAQQKSLLAYYPLIKANRDILANVSFDTAARLMRWHYNRFSETRFTDSLFRSQGAFSGIEKYGLPSQADFLIERFIMTDSAESEERDHVYRDPNVRLDSLEELEYRNDVSAAVLSAYAEYRGLTERARISGKPIKSKCTLSNTRIDRSLGPEAMQLFKVHLDEVRIMPYLGSLEDVYRLRGHKQIKNFRIAILEWLERMAAGEPEIEQKYRRSVKLANEELRKLDKWKYVNSPYTLVASIAVGVAEMFTGTPFGLLMSAASGAALLDKKRKEAKYGYAIFPK